jgi:putative ABC transport system permease protein
MNRLRVWLLRFASLLGMGPRDAELTEELEEHVAREVEDKVRGGMSPSEARRQAMIQLGGFTQARELCREQHRLPPADTVMQDLRYGARMLRRNPGYAALAIITLALGIGANTAIFSVVNTVMLRPLPYANAGRLVIMKEVAHRRGREESMSVGWQDFQDWRKQARSFQYLGVFRSQNVTLTGVNQAEQLVGAIASADVLKATGIRPLLGRTFLDEEDTPAAAPVVILSERLWRNQFGAAPDIVNRTITLDGMSYSVVGVFPASMRFPSNVTDFWESLGPYVQSMPANRDNHPGLSALGLLKPDISLDQSRSEMDTIAQRLGLQYPETNSWVRVQVTSLHENTVSGVRKALLVLLGAVVFVLLIACANLANMTLARGETRLREMAVRSALGASRSRLIRQLLVESAVLAGMGAVLGLALAWAALKALVASQPSSIPEVDLIGIDLHVLGFTCLVAVAVALLFGLWPALRITSLKPRLSLRELGTTASARSRLRPLLVAVEVSLAMVLLVGASLMLRTFSALSHVELGFTPEHVITMQSSLPPRNYSNAQWVAFYRNLLSHVETLPAVQAQGISSSMPLVGGATESNIFPDNVPLDPSKYQGKGCIFSAVSGGYLSAMGIPLLQGRTFTDQDSSTSQPVALIDEAAARAFWPNQNPIGHRVAFEFGGRTVQDPRPVWREIVGVVGPVRHYDLTSNISRAQVYVPYSQPPIWFQTMPVMTLAVRTAIEPETMVNSVRKQVAALDPAVPLFSVRTMTDYVEGVLEQPKLSMGLMTSFGALALILAAVGIYGVLSYSVSQRTHEIGIRTALGASRADIMRFIVGEGARPVVAGTVIGVLASLASTRLIRGLLFGISSTDKATYLLAPAILLAVSLLATLFPALRAARIDPADALRHE